MSTQPNSRPAADTPAAGPAKSPRLMSPETVEQTAIDALLSGDPVAVHIYRWAYRVGQQDAIDRLHARAEADTARFLADITDDGLTVNPLPPLENDRRNAA